LTYVASGSVVKRSVSIENGEEKKNKNADDTVQKSMDSTKQIKRKQEACWDRDASKGENADDTKQNADDTKQNADDTKQIEDDTKQNCGMKTYGICGSPWVPIL
ncbi:hypothetical protein T11_6744, partial [Trichinella zimbabwensis]